MLAAAHALDPTPESFLSHLRPLQKQYGSELAKAALDTAILRSRARTKFSRADKMYFIREALEQSSSEVVSNYRAQRFAAFARVADLGCGIGGDLLGLAAHCDVVAVDRDPLRLAMAAENISAYDLSEKVELLTADLLKESPPPAAALWFDPSRRDQGRRIFSVRDYKPSLASIEAWLELTPAIGVKLSPGVRLTEIKSYEAEQEFISVGGELKEAVLWFGPLRAGTRRATLLPSGESLVPIPGGTVPFRRPQAVLYEPDPAVLRAGLVQDLARTLGAAMIDPQIAYLTADEFKPTPFARAFSIEAEMPFSMKRVRAALRERGVGRLTVKKRGSPLDVDDFIRKMKLQGDPDIERVIFLTHVQGRHAVIIGQQLV